MDDTNANLVTARAVAQHFDVTVETVRGWVRRSLIPHIRVSRKVVRFRLQDVERVLAERAAAPHVGPSDQEVDDA